MEGLNTYIYNMGLGDIKLVVFFSVKVTIEYINMYNND